MDKKDSKLMEYAKKNSWNAIVPSVITREDGKEFLVYHNGRVQYLTREEMKFIADELYKTIELGEEIDKFIDERNTYNYLKDSFYIHVSGEGFKIPWGSANVRLKHFKPNKKWSFKCGNCSEKISIDDQNTYYSIVPRFNGAPPERACSKGCVKVIVKDIVQNWLHEYEYAEYFNTDYFEQELNEYVEGI